MRYSQIRAFHYVAVHGGFSRAAEAVFQSQPALSEQVRRLEQFHDVQLFRRDKKGVTLTPAGARLFDYSKRFFEIEQQMDELLSQSSAAVEGQLRIIADSAHHVTGHLARFRRRHPNVFVTLRAGNTTDILAELRAFNAEIGIVGSVAPGPDLDVLDLGSSRIFAFCARDYLPASVNTLTFADLAQHNLVFRESGSKTRNQVETAAAERGDHLSATMVVEGREALREVIATGAGIGFVSEAEFGNDTRLRTLPVDGMDMFMAESMVCLSTRRDLRIIRAFFDAARDGVPDSAAE